MSHNKIGEVLVAQGQIEPALAAFQASLAIRERLVEADPGNAGWRADLAASHGKIGQALMRLGRVEPALGMFRAGRELVAPLAASSGHALWRRYVESFDAAIAAAEARSRGAGGG